MAAIRFTQRTELNAYAYDEEHTVDVLITIRAERLSGEENRAPLCLSAAIDRSSSMRNRKLPLVKRTMQFVVRQLCETDRLGLVTYHTDADEALPLTDMTAEGKQKGDRVVKNIYCGRVTNLSGGLFKSIQQLKASVPTNDDGNPGPVAAVLLLTDGLATAGIMDTVQLQHELKNALSTGPPIKIHTFGYGNDHDARLLKNLADISGGNYYAIATDSDVPISFADALGGLVSVVVQNIAVDISPAQQTVQIKKIFTGLKIKKKENESWTVSSGDLYAEERKDIIVRLKIPALKSPVEAAALLHVQLSYFDVRENQTIINEAVVCVKRPLEVLEQQVVDQDFQDQHLRVEVTNAIEEAASMADAGNLTGALTRVDTGLEHVRLNFGSPYAKVALEDLVEARSSVSGREAFRRSGHILHRMASSHGHQRGSGHFRTTSQSINITRACLSALPDMQTLDTAHSGINPPMSALSDQGAVERALQSHHVGNESGVDPPRSWSSFKMPRESVDKDTLF